MEQNNTEEQPTQTDEERRMLEQLAKKKPGKPGQKQRHGANTWRQYLDEEEDD